MIYYEINSNLINKYSITDIDNMYPFEREVYVGLIIRDIEKEKEKKEQKKNQLYNPNWKL